MPISGPKVIKSLLIRTVIFLVVLSPFGKGNCEKNSNEKLLPLQINPRAPQILSPSSQDFAIILSIETLNLVASSPSEIYESSIPVEVSVQSFYPQWKLECRIEPIVSALGAFPPNQIFLRLGQREVEENLGGKEGISLEQPVILCEGGFTGPNPISCGKLWLGVKTTFNDPAGEYEFLLKFSILLPDGKNLPVESQTHITLQVEPYYNLQFSSERFHFKVTGPSGYFDADKEIILSVESNVNLNIVAGAQPLQSDDHYIPTKRLFVDCGNGYVNMENNVMVWSNANTGKRNLKFQLLTTLQDPPGEYKGKVKFTCSILRP